MSEFLGADGIKLSMLDEGEGPVAIYAVFAGTGGAPARLLIINSNYYDGDGARTSATVSFGNLPRASANSAHGDGARTVAVKRMTAPCATSQADDSEGQGSAGVSVVTIGGDGVFDVDCIFSGGERTESVVVGGDNSISVNVSASEALIVYM